MESLSGSGVMSDTPSRHSTDARYPSIDGTRCCRFSTSLAVAHSVGVTEAMISIDDGRWGWDGMGSGPFLSTVRCTSCGRSLEGHLTLAWKANGVHPHPSISPRWVHPSLPSTIPWQIGSPRDSFLVSFAHSRHPPIDHECSSRQVGGVSGSTTKTPSQCSFPSLL